MNLGKGKHFVENVMTKREMKNSNKTNKQETKT